MRQAQRYMGHVVRTLHRTGIEMSLASVVHHLDPAHLEVLARRLPEIDSHEVHAYLDSLTQRQRSDLSGVRDRLAIMVESDVGRWLDPATPKARRFDLLSCMRRRDVVCFRLQADRRPLLAEMLGAAIVQDLQTAVATLQNERIPVPSFVVIDEFSALAAEQVARLFGRARSAGMSLMLGTQELSDLRLSGHEALLEQVLGNITTLIAHRQVVPASAELISRMSGTKGAWSSSRSSNGLLTRKRVREGVVHPSEISGLARGCAVVLVPAEPGRAAVTRMYSPWHRS
jgi:type IV secretory pathway TraG/TraD family ATPase VirD4